MTMAIPDIAFSAVWFCTVRRTQYDQPSWRQLRFLVYISAGAYPFAPLCRFVPHSFNNRSSLHGNHGIFYILRLRLYVMN